MRSSGRVASFVRTGLRAMAAQGNRATDVVAQVRDTMLHRTTERQQARLSAMVAEMLLRQGALHIHSVIVGGRQTGRLPKQTGLSGENVATTARRGAHAWALCEIRDEWIPVRHRMHVRHAREWAVGSNASQ